MRVALATVVSLDGRITRGADPNVHAWTSIEDWRHFIELRNKQQVVIMDRETYEQVKPEAEAGLLRVVMTFHPELYSDKQVPGQLHFVQPKPKALVRELQKQGKERALIAGNSVIAYDFLRDGLVDDLYITFEPVLFGSGAPVTEGPRDMNIQAQLKSVRQLNEQGTLLAHYVIVR